MNRDRPCPGPPYKSLERTFSGEFSWLALYSHAISCVGLFSFLDPNSAHGHQFGVFQLFYLSYERPVPDPV